MPKNLKYIVSILFVSVVVLAFTKPNEDDYFNQIVRDYGQIHPDYELTHADFAKIGTMHYSSQVIMSSYSYQFGGLEVAYWGILGKIFYKACDDHAIEHEISTTIEV